MDAMSASEFQHMNGMFSPLSSMNMTSSKRFNNTMSAASKFGRGNSSSKKQPNQLNQSATAIIQDKILEENENLRTQKERVFAKLPEGCQNPDGTRWSKVFLFFNQEIGKTGGAPPQVTNTIQVPSASEISAIKPHSLIHLANMQIAWRQWGVGSTKLQGTPFSELSLGFGKKSPKEHTYKKDITWQDRDFDFTGEQKVTFNSSVIKKIHYNVKRYKQGSIDCSEVQISFMVSNDMVVGSLKSHNVPKDAIINSYHTETYIEDSENLKDSEIIIGARVNQDYTGANCSIQFLIADKNGPASRN